MGIFTTSPLRLQHSLTAVHGRRNSPDSPTHTHLRTYFQQRRTSSSHGASPLRSRPPVVPVLWVTPNLARLRRTQDPCRPLQVSACMLQRNLDGNELILLSIYSVR